MTLTLLMLSGAIESRFGYSESLDHISVLQEVQAESAAREISSYVANIEAGIQDVAKMPWGRIGYGDDQRRIEFQRLLKAVPAITELQVVDGTGREELHVSRSARARVGSGAMIDEPALAEVQQPDGVRHGRTFFRDGELPTTRFSAFDGEGAVVATVDLRLLSEVTARLSSTGRSLAYIVDAGGLLIAHPQPTHVLGRRDLSSSEAFNRAARGAGDGSHVRGMSTLDFDGQPVITTATKVPGTGWLVFMEQPRSEALKPAWATLTRTLLLVALGGAAALMLSVEFGRRMAAPIVALRRVTAQVADGQLEATIPPQREDEVGDLAADFNRMISRLRDLYASLEAKVAERTAQLSAARDGAERANAAKTRFLAAASHDLRQPMHSISLLLGVLQTRLDHPEHLALADKIQSSVATMESLFGNLLDISKLDAGAMQAHVEDVELGWLLHRLEQTWAPQAAEKGLRLRVRACHFVVRGDAALLERITGNLVANAIRYTRTGGVLVGCRRRGDQVELQVWDSGPGIEPRYREAIFEEFFRIEAPGTSAEKGLGLGLSIVQRCVHMLGYSLIVSSRVGYGTLFRLVMPLAPASAASHRASPRQAASQQALEGRFIVVVDDEGMNAHALVDALHACRCHVVAAAGCDEALAELQQHLRVPDLIVTDYQLGGGRDGFEVISRLRQHYDDDIAALMVTANTDASLQPRASAANTRLLHKPIGLQRLLEAMQSSLAP
ncbi:ATP-binding protein [Roseateles sp. DC23W]|uniref:histidine kinase n=1 Tax=Pelomonas dachongensis TaxID=3299029 RepID=A0ABW7EIB8_9BURK